ncbi:MAG TPA: hypothetical protein VF329_13315 [Gammaproteobacteria bacterium]
MSRDRISGFAVRAAACAAVLVLLSTTAGSQEAPRGAAFAPRFGVVDVYVESDEPLAAWQFELEERAGRMQVVGIEGGEAAAYEEPPYYDREAVQAGRADRIIVASFSTRPPAALPSGRTRIATVHVRLTGAAPPDYDLNLVAAGAPDGRPIDAEISLETRNGR